MDRETSLYLDIVRFAAATVVFFGHASGQPFTGGLLWQFGHYDQTAVIVFFVLSGFVIGYVAHEREPTLGDYALSRTARLSSVVFPALLLTFFCDYVGLRVDREFYFGGPWTYPTGDQTISYLLSFVLLQNVWELGLNPGINTPFWSLSFEVIYYAIFACAFYFSGWKRVMGIVVFCVAGGPTILALFPTWLMGYGCYLALSRHRVALSTPAVPLAVLSLGALVILVACGPWVREHLVVSIPYVARSEIVADYLDAILFSLHLLFCLPLLRLFGALMTPLAPIISFLGSLTFALYLFHRPVIQLLAVIRPDEPSSILTRAFIICGTFLVVMTIGRWCEKQKSTIKNALRRVLGARPTPQAR